MRVQKIAVVLRKEGFFHVGERKIKAVYPREGYVVMVFLEPSPIDEDFGFPVLVLSCKELEELEKKMKESDELTYKLRGEKGWLHGARPFFKVHEFM